jgi:hypothetical protein
LTTVSGGGNAHGRRRLRVLDIGDAVAGDLALAHRGDGRRTVRTKAPALDAWSDFLIDFCEGGFRAALARDA